MSKWFKEMNCYILAGGKNNPANDFQPDGDFTRLEKSFQSYAKVFDRVKLVIKEDQAKEHYLNYPHICDEKDKTKPLSGVAAALEDSGSEAVFIGSSEIKDFPPALLVDLIKRYNGESFLGYVHDDNSQPLFGIYNKRLADRLRGEDFEKLTVTELISQYGQLIQLPEEYESALIGL